MVKSSESEGATDAAEQHRAPSLEVSPQCASGFGRVALAALLVCVLALTAYAPIWYGDYRFLNIDDDEYVTANPQVQAGLTGPSLWWALTAYHSHNWHPLTWMSLQLDWQLYGPNPFGFHVTNVLLHTANTVLLLLALRSLTGAVWRSAVVAAFFAVHPLHVESVAWVAERKDVLSTLFWLLTLWAYSAYTKRPGLGRYLLTLALFGLGLTAKPMLVTLPFVLLLLDFWPLRRFNTQSAVPLRKPSFFGASSWWGLLKEKLPFFVLAVGCAVLTLQAQQFVLQPLDYLPLSERLANVPLAYLRYLSMMFWPVPLAVYYQHPGADISFGLSAAAAGMLLVFTVLALSLARRRPYLAVGWLWYLGTLVPVIGLVQVGRQAYADRYTYIPLIGVFLLLTWGAYEFLQRRHRARLAAVPVIAGLIAVCLVLTWRQLPNWRDSGSLWQQAVAVSPSGLAHRCVAMALEKEGRIDEARREYAEAIRCDPCPLGFNNVGAFLARHGWTDDALEHLAKSLELYPDQAPVHHNMGFILMEQGKLDESQRHLAEAVRLAPDFASGRYYLGIVLARQGRFRHAEKEFLQALKSRPGSANASYYLGVALVGQGRTRDAVPCFALALQSDSNHIDAHTSLGALLARAGHYAEGREHLLSALRHDSANARAHFNLGLSLELDEQFAEAAQQFAAAVAADPNDVEARRHLGTALIRQGKPEEAKPYLVEAIESRPLVEQFRIIPQGFPSR